MTLCQPKTYQFRISANNEVGISNPSEPSDSITMDLQTGVCVLSNHFHLFVSFAFIRPFWLCDPSLHVSFL